MAVQWCSDAIANGEVQATKSAGAANKDVLTLTPFSIATQTNQILILRTMSLNRGVGATPGNDQPAIPLSINCAAGTFVQMATRYFRDKGDGPTVAISYWALINPTPMLGITVTVQFDRASEIVVARIDAYKNAYQVAVPRFLYSAEVANSASISVEHLDPDPIGLIVDFAMVYALGLGSDSDMTPTSGQTVRGSGTGLITKDSGNGTGSTDGALGFFIADVGSPSAPQTISYSIDDATNSDAAVFSIEIKPDTWAEVEDPISGAGFCPYVSGGQVRKMVTNVTGLGHLEGEQVSVQADGLPEDSQTYEVVSGTLSPALPGKRAVVHVGLPYTGKIKLLKAGTGSDRGTGQFKTRRYSLAAIRIYRSLNFKIGFSETDLKPVILGNPALPLLSRDLEKLPGGRWGKEEQLFIIQDLPLPLFILAINLESEVEEGG